MVNALGPDFTLMGYNTTAVKSTKPVISICAVRTGCGKSQTTRYIYDIFRKPTRSVVAIRHPMPYGDLAPKRSSASRRSRTSRSIIARSRRWKSTSRTSCAGNIIYSGVDYEAIVRMAEKRDNPDIILFDGGNNDMPFYQADLKIVVVDPLRAGHEVAYYPGEANLRMADVVVINKMDSATPEQLTILATTSAASPPTPWWSRPIPS